MLCIGSGRGRSSESNVRPENRPSGAFSSEPKTSFSIRDHVLLARVSSVCVTCTKHTHVNYHFYFLHNISWLNNHASTAHRSHTSSLTPCVKVSSTSTMSACTLVSSPSRRPDAGMEHTIMWSDTNTLATRVSLNWKAPPRSSSVSMVRSSRSVLIHILRIMQRCGVGPMCPCTRHGCSKTLHSFCRTRTHVSRPSPEKSWTPARLHLRSLC